MGSVQGVAFEKSKEKLAVTLKWCIFDHMLAKPKCIWEALYFEKLLKQTAEKYKQIYDNWLKPAPLKHILALPTCVQICSISVLQPFLFDFFKRNTL